MRIVLSLGGNTLVRPVGSSLSPNQRREVETAAEALAEIATGNEVLLAHAHPSPAGHLLELALRNALPERDVVSVLTQVVVVPDRSSLAPHAIAEIRSLRVLLDSGALVICAGDNGIPVALDGLGKMREVGATVDGDLTAALLARRLDAELLMMLADPLQSPRAREAKEEAAHRFVEATGRRAVTGSLAELVGAVRSDTLAA
ncbi:MAG: hypothetical protein ACTHO8_03355 [Solirubrobacterales bacterium]